MEIIVTITCYLRRPEDASMTGGHWLVGTRGNKGSRDDSRGIGEFERFPRFVRLYSRGFAHVVFELHAQLNWLFPQSSHRIIIHWYCLAFSLFTSRAPTVPHVIISPYTTVSRDIVPGRDNKLVCSKFSLLALLNIN